MPERLEQLKHWLESELDFSEYTLNPASADASFRRYFRVIHKGESLIVMDAPPEKEDSRPFIDISRMFFDVGLNVPAVIDEDLQQGFLLLSDLGSQPYLEALTNDSVERLYGDALSALATIQSCIPDHGALPCYTRTLLLSEMALFREWLLGKHLDIALHGGQAATVDAAFEQLADNALQKEDIQPAPETVTAGAAEYICGFARLEGRLMILLDIDQLLDPEQLGRRAPSTGSPGEAEIP